MSFKDYIHRFINAILPRRRNRLGPLVPSTELSRFILDRKHFRKTKPRVKAKTFLPRQDSKFNALALSTFRIDLLKEEEIWSIGQEEIASIAQRTLKGRCDLPVQVYSDLDLKAVFDNNPPRHVNILGWPEAEDEILSIAQQLAAAVAERQSFYSLID